MPEAKSLSIGHLPTLYHTSFLLMGTPLLKTSEIQSKWVLFSSGPDLIAAMSEGHIDLAYVGLPPVIIGIDKGAALTCIAGGHIEGTLMIARGPIRPVEQCRSMAEFLAQFSGKAIGSPPRGTIHDVILNELLKQYRAEDVSVKNYAWADFLPDALSEGEIAAAVGTPALAVAARRYYGAFVVVPPTLLWPFNPSYGIVAMKEDVRELEDDLRRFLVAHEMASEKIRHDVSECAGIVAQTTGVVDAGFMIEVYRISPKYCAALPRDYISSTMKFVDILKALGYISRRISETEIFDLSLIREVHPEPPHYELGLTCI